MPHRHCYVELNNNTNCFTLANVRSFIESGVCEEPLPAMVNPCSAASAMFNKTTGAATGAVGVFTYDLYNNSMGDYSHVLAVMFSVPFDRNLYYNWYAVGVFERGNDCDHDLYDVMYNGSEDNFVRAKPDGSCVSYQWGNLIIGASMSDSGEAVLKLDVNDICMY
ncbi:uncharacterized protein [Brachionichthys hirsutus]|uniref:uncharacterized protein n=1 Tax=Brachionichthys hirsutus TaxID=412623 RepID=UPI003604D07B